MIEPLVPMLFPILDAHLVKQNNYYLTKNGRKRVVLWLTSSRKVAETRVNYQIL